MTVSNDAARRAAQEAARRRAAEEARRRAEEAAKKKAAEAAKKKAAEAAAALAAQRKPATVSKAAAQALSKAAGTKPSASAVRQSFGKDEMSTGLGRALRQRSTSALGAPAPSAPTAPTGRTTSLSELRAQEFAGAKAGAKPAPFRGTADAAERRIDTKPPQLSGPAVPAERRIDTKPPQLSGPAVPAERRIDTKPPQLSGSADAAERRLETKPAKAGATPLAFRGSADSLERQAQARAAKDPASSSTTSTTATTAPANSAEARAAADAKKVEQAWDDALDAGGTKAEAANAAAQELRELTKDNDDPAYKNALIRAAGPTLDKVTDVLAKNASNDGYTGDTDARAVKDTVRALSDVATEAGEIGSFLIADQLAQKLPDESELMHLDDGFYEHVDNGGEPQLMAALASRLEAHGKNEAKDELIERNGGGNIFTDAWDATGGQLISAAGDFIGAVGNAAGAVVGFAGDAAEGVLNVVASGAEMAVDVAKGTVELAGDAASWTTEQVTAAAEYAAKNGLKLAGKALNWVGDHARELAADALNIDGQLEKLNSPGDSVTLAIGGELGGAVFKGGAEVQMVVTKTETGYEMTLSGELSGGVFGGLKIPGFPAGAEGEASATGIASATMTFDSLEDVTTAAETVGGIGIAAAVGGPAGALLAGATAGDEIADITEHFTSGSVGLELSASATAELGQTAGIGAGGSVTGTVTTGARIEITPGQPPALVLDQGIEAAGSLSLGQAVQLPGLGGELSGGSIDGSASISAETRIPLPPGLGLGDVISDPVGSIKNVGQHVLDNATTKLTIGVDISAGQATSGLPIDFGEEGGLEIELSGEAKTKDLAGALGQALRGDLAGALQTLGTKTTLAVDVNSYTEDGLRIDESISVPGFTIGIHGEDIVRDETDVWSFEGTPAELARRGFDLFEALDLKVS